MSNTNTNTSGTAATGTNVYVNLLLLAGSLFGGMSTDTATFIVSTVMGVVAATFAVRNRIVNAKFSVNKSWIGDPNNLAYITAALTGLVPAAAPLVEPLRGLAVALTQGNRGAIVTGGVTLLSLVYYTWFKKK